MKIQNKLTLLFSLLFGAILFIFIVGVYQIYSNKCKDDYFERLHLRAALKADLIDGEAVAPDILHILYENTPPNVEPHVSIYDYDGTLIYSDRRSEDGDTEHEELVDSVRNDGVCRVWDDNEQTYGFQIEGAKTDYIVLATGYDLRGIAQLGILRMVLGIAYLVAMFLIVLTVRLFTKQAFSPVAKMTDKVKSITLSNRLNIRLDEGNRKDELARLAITFNQMLDRLEKAFESQKQFVYNISHELRTPLSAVITELELSKQDGGKNGRTYEEVIDNVLKDTHRLARLSNNLLDMAKANYAPSEIAMRDVRLDEILLGVCRNIQKSDTDYMVNIIFDKEEIDNDLFVSVYGNEYLLGVALGNIIENGCKFSEEKACEVHISYENGEVIVRITDNGTGIAPEDMGEVFTPFFRGRNKSFAQGNGIGLSLAHRIIDMHGGSIAIESRPGMTEFTVRLKNLM